MSMNEVVKKLSQAIDKQADKAKTTAYDTPATVRRIEGDTAWVHIPGGVDETPVKLTISAKEGDQVQVRVSGGNAFMVGNGTNPPTDDARANEAYTVATVAEGAAENALANASRAKEAADSAQASASAAESAASAAVTAAGTAQTAADTALVSLSTVEDVVGVLNWITAHGTMTLTSDATVNPAHVYFVVDPTGDYVVGGTHYSIVSEPKDAELSTYYELTVDESVQNYVATHIVVDTEGLWIVPDAGGNKVLIATGSGSTYTTAGTYIIGKINGTDKVLASYTSSGATIRGTVSSGNSSSATGFCSSAFGDHAVATGGNSFSTGWGTTANGFCQTVVGRNNEEDNATPDAYGFKKYAFIVGNGSPSSMVGYKRNAFTVDWSGNAETYGGISAGGDVDISSGKHYKINGTNIGASDVGAVPTSRTVNSKALSSDITLTASDVGAEPTLTNISESGGVYSGGIEDEKLLTTATINKWKTILGIS